MSIDPKRLGAELRALREMRGMSQSRVAEISGLTVNYVSLLENGDRRPSLDAINRLAKALRIPGQFLLFLGGQSRGRFKAFNDATCNAIKSLITAEQAVQD